MNKKGGLVECYSILGKMRGELLPLPLRPVHVLLLPLLLGAHLLLPATAELLPLATAELLPSPNQRSNSPGIGQMKLCVQ